MTSNKFDVFSSQFAQDIYKQKYSLDGTETWADTCERVVNAVCGQLLDTKEKNKIKELMLSRKFIPGGRYLYSSGRSFHQVNNCFDGSTRFITDKGVFSLKEKVNQNVRVKNWKGDWEEATVKLFGKQSLYKMTLSNGDEFLTTANHLWIQPDGSRVDSLNVKRVMLTQGNTEIEIDREGIRHGIIYGDGYKHPKTGYTEIVIVNPKKDEHLVSYFENKEVEITVGFGAKRKYQTIRSVAAGTKIGLQPKHYKELPITYSPEYARGFIAGLIATDGHASLGGSVLISCEGIEKAKLIRDIAIVGGCVVSSIRVNSRISPYTGESRELCNIYIKPFSAPIILPYHQENMKRSFYKREMYLDVVDVQPINKTEEVYCVVAPKTNTFTLNNGVITSNCFLFRAEDSREGWADALQKATAALMTGGGIGFDYSSLRAEGAKIGRTGGVSTGPIALMNMVNETGRYIMQGGQRRSAIWAGLQWDHGDVFKFINLKNHNETLRKVKETDFNFPLPMELTNISVNYNTEFFIAIEDSSHSKHEHAKKVWYENCKQAFSTAEPGMAFNFRKDAESLRNACVSGDTEILTDKGYIKIQELVGKKVNVWNGFEFSEVEPRVTGRDQVMVTVMLSDGKQLRCTANHKFAIANDSNGYSSKKDISKRLMIPACELEEGMALIKTDMPVIDTGDTLEHAYLQGFVSGDGMDGYQKVWIYEPKMMCVERLGVRLGKPYKNEHTGVTRYEGHYTQKLLPKAFVPVNFNLKSKLEWLAGFFDADATYLKEGGVQVVSIDYDFLNNIQKMLTTLGITSKVTLATESGFKSLPDGRGGKKDYLCQKAGRLLINSKQILKLSELGLKCERLNKIGTATPNRDASNYVTVVSVEESGTEDIVYCFTEPKMNLGCFEGIVTGQCTEVVSEDDSDKCNLGTVWMNRCVDRKEFAEAVKYATLFLLCGGLYSDVPTSKIKEVGTKNNRIGLGLGGIHEWLMQRGKDYAVDPELHKWLSVYEQESDAAAFIGSKKLNVAVPKGVRAIAPTGTIGIIAETTTGIEPLFCKAYLRRYYKEGKWLAQYVVDGSVKRLLAQGIKLEHIQDSYDLTFKQRVKFQADVQQYVDMAISSTCNMPSWGSEENNESKVKENADTLLKYAKRLRGFTVYPDGCRGGQPLTRVTLEEAMAAEGRVFEESELNCVNGVCGV